MKKFNAFEKGIIFDALKSHSIKLEQEIADIQETGKNPIFAPGFFTSRINELLDRVEAVSLKQR
jgi:hypothetical protein|tara:strand:+ start:676 stop:867 length:192 start_codon:yes stop_codon:yes gene_type:complete